MQNWKILAILALTTAALESCSPPATQIDVAEIDSSGLGSTSVGLLQKVPQMDMSNFFNTFTDPKATYCVGVLMSDGQVITANECVHDEHGQQISDHMTFLLRQTSLDSTHQFPVTQITTVNTVLQLAFLKIDRSADHSSSTKTNTGTATTTVSNTTNLTGGTSGNNDPSRCVNRQMYPNGTCVVGLVNPNDTTNNNTDNNAGVIAPTPLPNDLRNNLATTTITVQEPDKDGVARLRVAATTVQTKSVIDAQSASKWKNSNLDRTKNTDDTPYITEYFSSPQTLRVDGVQAEKPGAPVFYNGQIVGVLRSRDPAGNNLQWIVNPSSAAAAPTTPTP